jgi:hypothetical protein
VKSSRGSSSKRSCGANLPSIESLLAFCRGFERKPSEILSSIGF